MSNTNLLELPVGSVIEAFGFKYTVRERTSWEDPGSISVSFGEFENAGQVPPRAVTRVVSVAQAQPAQRKPVVSATDFGNVDEPNGQLDPAAVYAEYNIAAAKLAILNGVDLEFEYTHDGVTKNRCIAPTGVISGRNGTLITGEDLDAHGAFKQFRVDRIKGIVA